MRESVSVSQVNTMVADAIHADPRSRDLLVRGEISGFKHHIASGHWYFSLKDEQSSIVCVMFRQNAIRCPFKPQDGMSLLAEGYLDVFPRDGKVQLYVTALRQDGLGDLYAELERLKQKLSAEGLFAPERKRPLPMVPRKVAFVTSESGAALQDLLNVSGRRCPRIPIVLVPVTVQGLGAGEKIAAGVCRAGRIPGVDVIIVARGGGSREDLWCFNDEGLARAVSSSPVPVVSGVGHEIDISVCDLAADVRASTPSNAAELVFPDQEELLGRVGWMKDALSKVASGYLSGALLQLREQRSKLETLSPERRMERIRGEVGRAQISLNFRMDRRLQETVGRLQLLEKQLNVAMDRRLSTSLLALREAGARMKAISPKSVLERGYAFVCDDQGNTLPSAAAAGQAVKMLLHFADGSVKVRRVTGRKKNKEDVPDAGLEDGREEL